MAELNDWDVTAANNNDTPPDGFPENMAYSDVNDAARETMAVLKRFFADVNGSLAAAGSANTYTLTLNASYSAYFEGMMFACSIPADNTGATTINVNALGAKSVVSPAGNALAGGELITGGIYQFTYDGTNFVLLGSTADTAAETTGSFTMTLTGMSSATNGTAYWAKTGNKVTLYLRSAITGTSNAATLTATGLPAAIQPANPKTVPCGSITTSTSASCSGLAYVAASGTITFSLSTVTSSTVRSVSNVFPTSGTKGLEATWSITYDLD